MFATVAASAFAIRIHAVHRHTDRVMEMASRRGVASEHDASMWRLFVTSVQASDNATALYAYHELSLNSPNRISLRAKRDEIARSYHDQQMVLLAGELQRNDCSAASKRVAHLARLLPERRFNTAVCP